MHNSEQQREDYRNHTQVWKLLPWYVNDSLPAEERQDVSRHVAVCLLCRKELKLQSALRDSVRNQELEELVVVASFDRLSAKLRDEEEDLRFPPEQAQADPTISAGKFPGALKRWLQRQFGAGYLLPALSALVVIVILPGVAAQLLLGNHSFKTLSGEPTAATVTADLRLIFADGVSAFDRNAILESTGLSIVAGPDERGLYFVDAPDDMPAAALAAMLEQLRGDEKILFAESASGTAADNNRSSGER